MSRLFSQLLFSLFFTAVLFACKKSDTQDVTPGQFQPITFRFGPDSTAITIDNKVQVLKNMPRSADVKQLAARAVLPAGYSISPDPSIAKDYTKGVTYTITSNDGKSFTMQITALAYDASTNPYGVYTVKQLSDIRKGLNDSYVLMNDIQLPDLSAANVATITGISDYKDFGWFSIGSQYVNGGHVIFRGSLDGQNHVIKNFTTIFRPNSVPLPNGIDEGHDGKNTDGLFGKVIGGTIKNLSIQLSSAGINDFIVTSEAYGSVGALAGYVDSSTLTNCSITGNSNIKGGQYTGGLIGNAQNSTINKCYSNVTAANGSYAITSVDNGGGLIGTAYNSNITDCYASSAVISSVNVGGLIASVNACTVKSCYASGTVSEIPFNSVSTLIATNSIGGLIGNISPNTQASTLIQNCYAVGNVAGGNGNNTDFHKSTRIGGLIGQVGNSTGVVSVLNCYAAGAVTRVWTNATAPFLIGGLVGNTPNGVFVSNGVCTNYWDKTTTGQTNLGGANGTFAQDNSNTANGKTTAEMKVAGTYSNWDFSSGWNISSSTNNGYPYLRNVIK